MKSREWYRFHGNDNSGYLTAFFFIFCVPDDQTWGPKHVKYPLLLRVVHGIQLHVFFKGCLPRGHLQTSSIFNTWANVI